MALRELIEQTGGTITSDKTNAGIGASGGTRKSLDAIELHAPAPADVLTALKAWENNADNVPTHDDFVAATAAIKASLGPAREDHYADFEEWALTYDGNDADYVRKTWDSVTDAEIGWEWLSGRARSVGDFSDAQADFADAPPAIRETPYDRMLARSVYVSSQNSYYDTEDGALRSRQAFQSKYTSVAPFGSTGVKTADAIFQNARGARKVQTIAVKPGAEVITETQNENGVSVSAVNLWKPSPVSPNTATTAAAVAPWLDLVEKLFGREGTPEREHFLNYWSYLLQRIGHKIGHALVLAGPQGTGKDTVLRPLFEAVGTHNVATIDSSVLNGPWNFYLKSMVVYVQEATRRQADFYNKLKPYISAECPSCC